MSYKVLIVDDSKLARMVAIKTLMALRPDWSRIEAASADAALDSVRQDAPDIALVDFNMPGRNGLVLAAELRDLNPRMPVALVSANHQTEIIDRTQAIGATFLAKPLTEQSLEGFLTSAAERLEATMP